MQNQRVELLSEESSLKRRTLATVLQALTDPALTRFEADDLSRTVLRCLCDMMAADNLAILLLTEDHTALRIHMVLGLEETVVSEVHIPLGRGFAGQIITQGLPLIVHDTSTLEIITPVLREQLRSLLGVPLIVHKQIIGVLHVGMKRKYLFTDSDVALLLLVADSLTQAFERTLLIETEHHAVEELIDAQLCAVVELVQAQQRVATELMEAQQHVAVELVGAHLHTAIELVETQLHTAIELVETQQHTAGELVETQQHTAGELVETQQHTAGELVETQQHTARKLVETQQHTAGELVETHLLTAVELVATQLHAAVELVEAQKRVAIELMEEQQRARIKAFEQMNELETIFNAIMDGIIVYDEQEHILRSNRAAHQLKDAHGYSFSPQHLPLKRLLDGERLAAKQAVPVHLHTLDDGDVQLSVTGAPLYDQEGHLYGAVCVLCDVTTRKHMEQRVEILEVLLQIVELLITPSAQKELVFTQDDPALVTQQIEIIILALAQHLLGCSHAIIMGIHQSTHLLSPLALAGFSTEQEQRLKTDLTDAHLSLLINDLSNVALLEKQGSVPFLITQSPLLPSLSPTSSSPNCHVMPIYLSHHLIGLLGIMFPENTSLPKPEGVALMTTISKLCALALQYEQQTTERDLFIKAKILLNEQLEQVNKMQEDFISVVSHEFRTTLTTIEGFSDLLRSEEYPDEEVKDYANDIYTDAIRLHRMVTDLLDLEQMKKGKMQLHMVGVDMNTLLTTTAKHMEQVSTGHSLHLSLDEKVPQLEGDPDKLQQVIVNVFSNAIKYSPMGGEILVKSWKEEKSVHVSIQDHGIGIPSEVIENIFTPYHRVNSRSTRYIEGTGLGLSLVQEILHLHEGKIWVESTPGHGSTFHFSLPLTRETFTGSNEEMHLEA